MDFNIQINYTETHTVKVQAKSLEEAREWAKNYADKHESPNFAFDQNAFDDSTSKALIEVNPDNFDLVTSSDFTRVSNDTNGNPRYVCHFLRFILKSDGGGIEGKYSLALSRAKQLGGRKFHNKQYGGGIAFQSYNIETTCHHINKLLFELNK